MAFLEQEETADGVPDVSPADHDFLLVRNTINSRLLEKNRVLVRHWNTCTTKSQQTLSTQSKSFLPLLAVISGVEMIFCPYCWLSSRCDC
jgi:hypothetical protein